LDLWHRPAEGFLLLYRQPRLFWFKLLDPGWKKPLVTNSLDSVFLMTWDAM